MEISIIRNLVIECIVGTHRTAFYNSIDLECMAYEVLEADDLNLGIIGLAVLI